jgi:hypothetical protein
LSQTAVDIPSDGGKELAQLCARFRVATTVALAPWIKLCQEDFQFTRLLATARGRVHPALNMDLNVIGKILKLKRSFARALSLFDCFLD